MIGMNFSSFLTLLVLGFIAAVVLQLIVRYHMLRGFDGFLGKWIAGWIGGWIGSPVLGHWSVHLGSIYIIPAVIGAFAGAFCATAVFKASAAATHQPVAPASAQMATQLEMRKAS